jgi:hypothetical protein
VLRLRRSYLTMAAAPWILAGGLLLAAPTVSAQDDTTTAQTDDDGADDTGSSVTVGNTGNTGNAADGAVTTALPRTGAGILAGGESSWLSLGAVAGAAVAAVYAMRERLNDRR